MLFPVSSKIAVLIRNSEVGIEISEGLVDFEVVFFLKSFWERGALWYLELWRWCCYLGWDLCTGRCKQKSLGVWRRELKCFPPWAAASMWEWGLAMVRSPTVCWKHPWRYGHLSKRVGCFSWLRMRQAALLTKSQGRSSFQRPLPLPLPSRKSCSQPNVIRGCAFLKISGHLPAASATRSKPNTPANPLKV